MILDGKIPYSNTKVARKLRECPVCGKKYRGYPALSRIDNKTEICPECGTKEAIQDFLSQYESY